MEENFSLYKVSIFLTIMPKKESLNASSPSVTSNVLRICHSDIKFILNCPNYASANSLIFIHIKSQTGFFLLAHH